jgi:hypothetical protein
LFEPYAYAHPQDRVQISLFSRGRFSEPQRVSVSRVTLTQLITVPESSVQLLVSQLSIFVKDMDDDGSRSFEWLAYWF